MPLTRIYVRQTTIAAAMNQAMCMDRIAAMKLCLMVIISTIWSMDTFTTHMGIIVTITVL
ncbi:TPA: hypothetical protein ACG0T4_000844 [Enterobacter hormaechei]|uniref:hypothetical protein n=1 Tax=Enterobacter kobei TaxID=208224 RepID=UPI0020761208|nr:hypothetical protein [Enterobacter kobei]MCM7487435.1 hypothetical protein [Enterobacter kobei]